MKFVITLTTTLIVFLMTTQAVHAEDNGESVAAAPQAEAPHSNRIDKKLGAYVGILGDPAPTLIGLNAAYNVTDYMRATLGVGQVSMSASASDGTTTSSADVSITTVGAGAKFFWPGLSLSPMAGLGVSHVFVSKTDNVTVDVPDNNIYLSLGADWQASSGFNVGVGFNKSLNSTALGFSPYFNLGWFL